MPFGVCRGDPPFIQHRPRRDKISRSLNDRARRPFYKAPYCGVAIAIGMRVTREHTISNICSQIPGLALASRLGNLEPYLCQVAGVIAILRIDRQQDLISSLYKQASLRRGCRAAEVNSAFVPHGGTLAAPML